MKSTSNISMLLLAWLLPLVLLLFWSETRPLAAATDGIVLEHTEEHDMMLLLLTFLCRREVMKCCCSRWWWSCMALLSCCWRRSFSGGTPRVSVIRLAVATLAWTCLRQLVALVLDEMVDLLVALKADRRSYMHTYKLAPINDDQLHY